MARHLIVTEPFGDFTKGARIEDPALVEKFEASHPASVVAVTAPDAPKKPALKDDKA